MSRSPAPDLSYIAEPLRGLAVPADSLNLDPQNARRHDQRNLDAIKASLRKFGQRLPIVVQRQGMIVRAGNARLMVARELGWTHIAAVVVDEADVDAAAFALADNRTAELATWDDATLKDILAQLSKLDNYDLAATGFLPDEVDELLAERPTLKHISAGPPPPMAWVLVGVPVVRFGDIAQHVEELAKLNGVICESTMSNYAGHSA